MKIKVSKKINDYIFYSSYFLYFIPRYFQYTTLIFLDNVSEIMNFCKVISYFLFFILCLMKLNIKKVSIRKMTFYIVTVFVILYQVVLNDANSVFVVLLISMAFGNRNVKNFLKITLGLEMILFCIVILLAFNNIISSQSGETVKYGIVLLRNSFGFNYPGQLQMSLMPIVFLYYYLRGKKINMIENIVWIAITGRCFYFSMTVMPFFITIVFIIIFNIINKFNIDITQGKFKNFITNNIALFSVCLVGIIIFLRYKNNAYAIYIDEFVNYRISLNIKAITYFGISLFGSGFHNIAKEGAEYLVVDSEYIFMLVSNGILYTIIALLLIRIMIKISNLEKNGFLCLILVIICINATMNNGIFNLVMNPFVIMLVKNINFYLMNRLNIKSNIFSN